MHYEGHCYRRYRSKKTYVEARDVCKRYGGDLVSVHSDGENDFVASLTCGTRVSENGRVV